MENDEMSLLSDRFEEDLDNIREYGQEINEAELPQGVKQAIADYMEVEFDFKEQIDNFDRNHPDLKHVNLAYTTTDDNRHDVNFEINLVDYTWTQYVDDLVIDTGSFKEENGLHTLVVMKEFMEAAEFCEMIYVDDEKM